MGEQPKCPHCKSPMKIKPYKPDERKRPKHVEGKGTYIPYKCENPGCGAEQEIFSPYKP